MMTDPVTDSLDLPVDHTDVRAAAVMYARAGFAPVPVHGVKGQRCGCGRKDCSAVGKHPVGGNWQRRATPDVDATRELFHDHDGNIGIVPGDKHLVLDVDYYAGGKEGLAQLGPMPPTLTSASGSGQGEHRIFAYAPGQDPAEVTNRKVAPGVDIKTRTGQIVVAPSLHVSGGQYRWIDSTPPAPLPDDLYERIRKRRVIPIAQARAAATSNGNFYARARGHVRTLPIAVAGQHGHDATFYVARVLWGWVQRGLSESDAWSVLLEHNQRCEPPWSERELRHKFDDAQKADRIPVPEDRPLPGRTEPPDSTPPDDPPEDDWRARLIFDRRKSGPDKPAKHHENAVVVLRYHPAWRGRVSFDEHAQRVIVAAPPWHESDAPGVAPEGPREWTDADSSRLSSWIRREVTGLDLSVADCDRAITIAAESNPCHPFRDYLDSVQWDETRRLDRWLVTYLGVADTEYARLVGRWWLIAAVARTYRPGEKADNVLILEGAQGIRKSTSLRTLAGSRWFTDTPIDIGAKDAFLAVQGRVIVELGELDSLKRSDADRAKVFFSSAVDHYRPPYGRRTIAVPRGCVFAGTVNHATYLTDDTGNRRYWPVRCSTIDLTALAADRDQIWAEAVAAFREGANWWPETDHEKKLCSEEQEPRADVDPWEEPIAKHVAGQDSTSTADVMQYALKLDVRDRDRRAEMRVARILVGLGYERKRTSGVGRPWAYLLTARGEGRR